MEKNNIIAISRTYGSNGKGIGKKLAEQLGYTFFDKDIMRIASEKTGLGEEYFKSYHSTKRGLLYFLSMGLRGGQGTPMKYDDSLNDDRLFEIQSDIIKERAKEGNCVFVGRCAGYVLRNFDNCLNVYIDSTMDLRVERIAKRYNISESAAKKKIQKIDKNRRVYYSYYTNREWGNPANFDLCINTEKLGEDGTVALIKQWLDISK